MAHDEHAWFRERLDGHALGALTEEGERRFDTHLRACGECRAWYDEVGSAVEVEDAADRHVPAYLMARWEQAGSRLQGEIRELIEHHLQRCASCREDLAMLGHAPALPGVESPRTVRRAPVVSAPGPSRWRERLQGGFVGAVLAAAVAVFALLPRSSGDPQELVPWVAPSQLRGGAPSEIDRPDSGALGLVLAVPLGFDASQPAQILVTGPQGATVLRHEVPAAELRRSTLVVLLAARELEPGLYDVKLYQGSDFGPDASEQNLQFRLK